VNSLQKSSSSPAGSFFSVSGCFSDIDHLTEVARAWNVEFLQIGRGAFNGRFFQVASQELQLTEAHYSQPLEQHGLSPRGLRTFAIPTELPIDLRWRNFQVNNQHLMVFPRGGEMYSITKPDFRVFTFSVCEEALARIGEATGFPEVADFLESGLELISVTPESMGRLIAGCRFAVTHFSKPRISAASTTRDHHLFDSLMALLSEALVRSSVVEQPTPGSRVRGRALRKAREYVTDRMSHPIAVRELCDHCGVSVRTLQYAFREELGITPKAWLQAYALNQIRRRLRKADPFDTRIADVANEWGFWHMGKFAADYRRQFSELPSQTLAAR
jgi:AraC family ethanolamine operon transcriptional activator